MSKPIITIVAAVSDNNIIGDHNDLPWYIPEDLKHFKALTTGQTAVSYTHLTLPTSDLV